MCPLTNRGFIFRLASLNSAFSRGKNRNGAAVYLKSASAVAKLPREPYRQTGDAHTLRLFYIYWRCVRDLRRGVLTKINQIRRHFFFFFFFWWKSARVCVCTYRRCLPHSLSAHRKCKERVGSGFAYGNHMVRVLIHGSRLQHRMQNATHKFIYDEKWEVPLVFLRHRLRVREIFWPPMIDWLVATTAIT